MGSDPIPTWAYMSLLGLLQLLIGFLLHRVWLALDKNTEAVTEIRVDLPTFFVSKSDHNRLDEYARQNVHDIKEKVSAQETEIAELRVEVGHLAERAA